MRSIQSHHMFVTGENCFIYLIHVMSCMTFTEDNII